METHSCTDYECGGILSQLRTGGQIAHGGSWWSSTLHRPTFSSNVLVPEKIRRADEEFERVRSSFEYITGNGQKLVSYSMRVAILIPRCATMRCLASYNQRTRPGLSKPVVGRFEGGLGLCHLFCDVLQAVPIGIRGHHVADAEDEMALTIIAFDQLSN